MSQNEHDYHNLIGKAYGLRELTDIGRMRILKVVYTENGGDGIETSELISRLKDFPDVIRDIDFHIQALNNWDMLNTSEGRNYRTENGTTVLDYLNRMQVALDKSHKQ
jgi:hypothetical protein